jgi:hypothetical protein
MAGCTGRPSAPISPERRKTAGDQKSARSAHDRECETARVWRGVHDCAFGSEPRSDLGGKRHGINSPHARWRKNWKDVTPPGLSAWSKISFIEASHFDPAVAYAAVDRSRLEDRTPYLYRTRDYGATWQLITNGIAAGLFPARHSPGYREKDCSSPEPNSAFTCHSTMATTGNLCNSICRSLPFAI